MMHSMKSIREKALATLKTMGAQLIKASEVDATVETRRQLVDGAKMIQCVEEEVR